MIIKNAISTRTLLYACLYLAILVQIVFLYKDIFMWMKTAWLTYPPDRFGPYVIVIFICMFLYHLFKKTRPAIESSFRGLSIIIIGILIFLLGYVADIHIIQAASFILICFGIMICILGRDWGKTMLFPFFFLILMLPTIPFLLESIFGVPTRYLIAYISGTILDLTGGDWRISGGVLYLNEINLPINYIRHSVSSPYVILIMSFIFAEIEFNKNLYKFMFVILFWLPLVVIGHSTSYVLMGWAYEHDFINLSEVAWYSREWFLAALFLAMLLTCHLTIRTFKKNRTK